MAGFTVKSLVLKLGSDCNLSCKYCHCQKVSYPYNPDIIDYINSNGYNRLTFSGGEPLIYFDRIKEITEQLINIEVFKLVTNTTLLTSEMVEFFNKYNFHIGMSFDGYYSSSRDNSYLGRWEKVAQCKNNGIAVLFSEDTKDVVKLDSEVLKLYEDWHVGSGPNYWMNFVHQTKDNLNINITRDTAKLYCQFMAVKLESEFREYKRGSQLSNLPVLFNSFKKWIRRKSDKGVACFRENLVNLSIDGRFLLCPYTDKYVGDIYTGIVWSLVDFYTPEKCKSCPIFSSCKNTCVTNVTENECFISKVMHKHFHKLMDKYQVSYDELDSKIRW